MIRRIFKNEFKSEYLALLCEAYSVTFTVFLFLLFFQGNDIEPESFGYTPKILVTSIILIPIVETLIFNLFLPYVLYLFDAKPIIIAFICAAAFSSSHAPDVYTFYLFYFIFGWYLSTCSNKFIFKGNSLKKGICKVWFMHAFWNLFIISTYFIF